MTVVGVSHGYPPLWNMGGEVSLHRTLTSIKEEVVVLTSTQKDYSFEGIKVKQVNTPNVLNFNANPQPIAEQIQKLGGRVVIGQSELSLPAVLAAQAVGAISIVNVHAPPKYGREIREAVVRADYAIYNTEVSARQWGEPNAIVLHPPITALPKNVNNNGDAYTVLSSLLNKGVEVVLALAKMYPDKRFIIVRSPAEPTHGLKDLEERAALLPNVELHPRVPPEEVYKYFEQTRILLVPSRYETYGMSAIEAAGYGIPSIHVDTPHVREGIGDAAILIKPLSVEDAAKGIEIIESDYEAHSIKARKKAEWLQARQLKELEKFSEFIANVKKPKEFLIRQKSIIRNTRKNFQAS
jgi:glycosyltransferase involved in cell wall biosynthesis